MIDATAEGWELAQVNVSRLRTGADSPEGLALLRAAASLGQLAEESAGYIWCDRAGPGLATAATGFDPRVIVNVSVWDSYRRLHEFTYRGAHGRLTAARRDWFERRDRFSTALWWVRSGVRPSLEDGVAHLAVLNRHGPTPRAFSLLHQFDPTGRRLTRRA